MRIETTYDHLVKWMIDLNKENRIKFERKKFEMPIYQFIFEFGTISIDIGRAVGKTNFIAKYAKAQDLVLTFSHTSKYDLKQNCIATILTCDDVPNFKFTHREIFETIYVDEPHLTFRNNDKFSILKSLIHNEEQTIVMLGI